MGDHTPDAPTTLECYYCLAIEGKEEFAHVTVHDRRGCHHVCLKHLKWKLTTSWMFGHSADCVVGADSPGKKAP